MVNKIYVSRTNVKTGQSNRRGATLVEFAIVAPIVFLLIVSFVEFGRFLMVYHLLNETARSACRTAVLADQTTTALDTQISLQLDELGVDGESVTITPNDLSTVEQWDPVKVDISVPYSSVSWLPTSRFLQNSQIQVTCTMPKESDESADDE